MTLREYLNATGMKQSEFARMVDTTRANMCHLVAGHQRPGLDLALRIQLASAGQVTVADWGVRRDGKPVLRGSKR
jgi:plasmid maintenance system antidote protein VapI